MADPWFMPCTLDEALEALQGDVLVITPLYPLPGNPYACAFVHARVQAYCAAGFSVNVVSRSFDGTSGRYEFEGVLVHRLTNNDLQILLRRRRYPVIAIHFLENEYARVLESCDLSRSRLLIWCHGAETLYWDRPQFTTPYFARPRVMEQAEIDDLRARDAMLARFNDLSNATFVFVSDFVFNRSEELLGITWNDARVIPNLIDFDTFAYQEKPAEFRNKVLCVKTQSDDSCYAMDTVVRTIMALSRRPCFDELSFTIIGSGSAHEKLVAPLRAFPNVRIVDRFLTHEEVATEHRKHGVALFPTRFDSQGVSMCEAAASGLAVISSKRDSVAAFLADDGLLVSVDDFSAYADVVERLHDDPDFFIRSCRASYKKVVESCAPSVTLDCEIELLETSIADYNNVPGCVFGYENAVDNPFDPVLTIAVLQGDEADIAALRRVVAHRASGRVEVLAAPNLSQAIMQSHGKYVKFLFTGDFCDPENLPAFLDYLKDACEHVVLADCWKLSYRVEAAKREGGFGFMVPGLCYEHDDVCLPDYGFAGVFPGPEFAVFLRKWLKTLTVVGDRDNCFDDLVGIAPTLSCFPEAAWHIRERSFVDTPENEKHKRSNRAVINSVRALRLLLSRFER